MATFEVECADCGAIYEPPRGTVAAGGWMTCPQCAKAPPEAPPTSAGGGECNQMQPDNRPLAGAIPGMVRNN